jgi:hypothetical protein
MSKWGPESEFYNIREMMVLVEIKPRETYRKLAGFYPVAEGDCPLRERL